MSATQSNSERRAFGRRSAEIPARVRGHGSAALSCTIRDISAGGALLEFPAETTLPSRVWLCVEDGCEVLCDVKHMKARHIGVEFLSGAPPLVLRQVVAPIGSSMVPPKAETTSPAASRQRASLVTRVREDLQSRLRTPSAC